jgi:hypothetical protein
MSSIPTISKLEAANRQLCTAIRMFFSDDNAVAVHTLACAAREIYEKHCRKSGSGSDIRLRSGREYVCPHPHIGLATVGLLAICPDSVFKLAEHAFDEISGFVGLAVQRIGRPS